MSTKTTKPRISEESQRKIQEYETTQRLYEEYDQYLRDINNSGQRAKTRIAKEIGELGDDFIQDLETREIEEKKKIQEEKRLYEEYSGKVEFIVKHSGDKYGSLKKLNTMTYEEIDGIYNKVLVESEKGFWAKLLDFLMGW